MSPNVTETTIRHAQALYHKLEELAQPEEVQGRTLTVFRGSLTGVFDDLQISRSYYTPISTLMRENDCISIIQKGSRSVESVIVLHREPSPEGMTLPPLTGRSHGAKVDERLDALDKRTKGIDIVKALEDHEKRLRRIEGQLRSKSKGR